MRGLVRTGLGPIEMRQLLCLTASLSKQGVEFLSFPGSPCKSARVRDPVLGHTSIQAADFEILKICVRRLMKEGIFR